MPNIYGKPLQFPNFDYENQNDDWDAIEVSDYKNNYGFSSTDDVITPIASDLGNNTRIIVVPSDTGNLSSRDTIVHTVHTEHIGSLAPIMVNSTPTPTVHSTTLSRPIAGESPNTGFTSSPGSAKLENMSQEFLTFVISYLLVLLLLLQISSLVFMIIVKYYQKKMWKTMCRNAQQIMHKLEPGLYPPGRGYEDVMENQNYRPPTNTTSTTDPIGLDADNQEHRHDKTSKCYNINNNGFLILFC